MKERYSIGEVAEQTGLSTREIKYYGELKIIEPSIKEKQGNRQRCFYSATDVKKIKQLALFNEIGYSKSETKTIFNKNTEDKIESLKFKIAEMKKAKEKLENRIIASELLACAMEYFEDDDYDLSVFDNDIDQYVKEDLLPEPPAPNELHFTKYITNALDTIENDEFVEASMEFGRLFAKIYYELLDLLNATGSYDEKKVILKKDLSIFISTFDKLTKNELADVFSNNENKLLLVALLKGWSSVGIDRLIDGILGKENTLDILLQLFEETLLDTEE